MFAISSLFSAVGVAAAFDSAIAADAANGRVNRSFAMLAVAEYGLPMLKADGHPINKAAFLKLADGYRAAKGKGHGIKGHKLLASWGAALDSIVLGMRAGAAPTAEQVQALTDAGQYAAPEAWAAMTAPAAKPAKVKAAPKVGEPAPVNTDKAGPATRAAQTPGVAAVVQPVAAPVADTAPDVIEVDLTAALDAVLLGLQTGAFTAEEITLLALAVADASAPRVQAVESLAAAVH